MMAISATSIGPSPRAPLFPIAVGFASAIGAGTLLFFFPGITLADNCSSLGDCWSTASGAASAAAGTAFGAIGGLFWGTGSGPSGGSSGGGGAGSTWPPPEPGAPSAPPRDHYPFPGPGEPTGDDAAVKRVRDYYRDVQQGKRSPRSPGDAWEDLERVAPKLDLDDEQERHYWEESEKKMPYAQRG